MLKYFALSTRQLLPMMLLVALMFSYMKVILGDLGKRFQYISVAIGLLSAVIMTIAKNATNKVDTSIWNLRIYIVTYSAFILFVIFTALLKKRIGKILAACTFTLISIVLILYFAPPYLEDPYIVFFSEQSMLNTNFLYSIIGMLFGLALSFVFGLAVYKGAIKLERGKVLAFTVIIVLLNMVHQLTDSFSIMLARRIIKSNHIIFVIVKYSSNYAIIFDILMIAVCLIIPFILFGKSRNVNEPYDNPAQHRKIKAKWRNIKRWSKTVLVCVVMSVLTITAIAKYADQEIELSPIEDTEITNDSVIVPFDKVKDGHLHRFGYKTENGKTVRFIVIKKPNSNAYGIGLDACDICGETGYYEKDGQVVCNLCNVVMNINTIGFKGGCNPIVIDYKISDGKIIVPIAELVKHEDIFKK